MLAVQEQRIALEIKQAEVSLREIEHNQKIADKSIEAQAEDRKDERRAEKSIHAHRLIFASFIVAAVLAFVAWALSMGKDAIVLDIMKTVLGFVGGWGASLAWIKSKNKEEK
jgi:Flp pilus assembly protein TadB